MKHENKIALVTGSSRGLGRNIALKLAQDGADVIVTFRQKKEEGAAVVQEIQALGRKAVALQLDTAKSGSFAEFKKTIESALQETWQRKNFDFLVNNAGINVNASFVQTTEQQFDDLVNVHFKGVFFLTQTLLPLLADGGRIVNTSSGLARFTTPGYIAYASLKGAIEVFTRYLAQELGGRQIRANVVAPGIIATDFTKHALDNPGMKEVMAKRIALGRVGEPDDIGGVVSFLCSEEGRWVNGQRLEASGGMNL